VCLCVSVRACVQLHSALHASPALMAALDILAADSSVRC
jgi:hypothetical protein